MTEKKKSKVIVAMSGGVDSSVAAAILKEQGYDVTGVFMQFWFPLSRHSETTADWSEKIKSGHTEINVKSYEENRCCSLASWQEAKKTAEIIGIPIYKLNFGREFKKAVVDDFLAAYRGGLTPNPCVTCNKFIKFGLLWRQVRAIFDADYLATGHYVQIKKSRKHPPRVDKRQRVEAGENKKSSFILLRAKDQTKDQTYFLYNLKQKDLTHLLFPLGGYQKIDVRKMAFHLGLPVYDKKDSQEICFVGKSHHDFLKKYLKLKSGKIVSEHGLEIGQHFGLPLYTIGQREGLGLSDGPWYMCGFDRLNNFLIVTKNQKSSRIFQDELEVKNVNWLGGRPNFPLQCLAQIRYHARPAPCVVKKNGRGLKVEFKQKQRAITPGQSVVFYKGEELLGGGIIM